MIKLRITPAVLGFFLISTLTRAQQTKAATPPNPPPPPTPLSPPQI